MFYGLTSALAFGFADLLGAVSSKRIGAVLTVFIIQVANLVILTLLLPTPIAGSLNAQPGVYLAIGISGCLGTVSFLSFYHGLELGPVAIVSPVFAAYAAFTVILAVLFNGERLSTLASTGIAATIGGVVLASVRTRSADGEGVRSMRGIAFALVATGSWGIASYLLGRASQEAGWFLPLYGIRIVEFVGVGGVLLFIRARGTAIPVPSTRFLAIVCACAVLDSLGLGAFNRGSQLGLVSITSAVSAAFPLVVIAGSLVLFRERPTRLQWLGILTAIAGLVVLGATR